MTTLHVNKEKINIDHLGPAQLAYIGDAVYEICIRQYLLGTGISKPGRLQKLAEGYVKAQTQHKALEAIRALLTAEEDAIVLRGRNHKHKTRPKNATVEEYNNATGFEALIGYLYLKGRSQRIDEIVAAAIQSGTEEDERVR